MAEGLREIMAELGYRTINEMVGQSQHLKVRSDIGHWKYKNLDLNVVLHKEAASRWRWHVLPTRASPRS